MSYDDLCLLIDYNYWSRDRVLEALAAITPEQFRRPMGNSFSSLRDTVAHLCDAERIWIARVKGDKPLGFQDPERHPDLDTARKEWVELEAAMRELLAAMAPDSIGRIVEYQDLQGNDRESPVWQVLQHVVNHGSYHRGQITTMLRQQNAAPAKSMDLRAFYHEQNPKP